MASNGHSYRDRIKRLRWEQQAIAHIAAFTITDDVIRAYCATQQRLAALFRQPELLHQERSRVAAEVVKALKRVL